MREWTCALKQIILPLEKKIFSCSSWNYHQGNKNWYLQTQVLRKNWLSLRFVIYHIKLQHCLLIYPKLVMGKLEKLHTPNQLQTFWFENYTTISADLKCKDKVNLNVNSGSN